MGKRKIYFLAARDKRNNEVKFISVNGEWGSSLEEIDLYTINYNNERNLIEYLYSNGIVSSKDIDLFIVNKVNVKDVSDVEFQEVLYSDSKGIKNIAENFKNKTTDNCSDDIDNVLNKFCYRMEHHPTFYDMVTYGETNIYEKFVNYFSDSRYTTNYSLKYKDGGWARHSYNLIRNIYEAFSRHDKNKNNASNVIARGLIRSKLIMLTDSNYDANQISFFDIDYVNDNSEKDMDDKMVEVMNTFDSIDRDTFIDNGGSVTFNCSKFDIKSQNDKSNLSNLLDENLRSLVSLYTSHRCIADDVRFNEDYRYYYEDLMFTDKRSIMKRLNDSMTLNNAYLWCLLYNEYSSKKLGDVHGYEYRKKED